jgi:hypothetical protein
MPSLISDSASRKVQTRSLQLPPFDESRFEPMPDVELNPKDDFWVDPYKLDSP